MEKETIIGQLNLTYEQTILCTLGELYSEIHNNSTVYTPKQYCDWRYSTNLVRFNYDPFTGEKIDWKKVFEFLQK